MNIILWYVVKLTEEVTQYKKETSCFGMQARDKDGLDEEVEEDTKEEQGRQRYSKDKINRPC